ncbi:hypothetical protein ACIRVF_39325 [Kitasatospora sp. NPDC101157]|uniref:hypothetical protein n=1 Tax=Kitasatospora sp. NPDC101157 TaxID=3364098 RepID=UPI0038269566
MTLTQSPAAADAADLLLFDLDHDPGPAEQAFADDLADEYGPETFLWISVRQPDGGAHVHYRWTDGGRELGDRIDHQAIAAGLNTADWSDITSRHLIERRVGATLIHAHPLRPILADVTAGLRAPAEVQATFRRMIQLGAEHSGQYALAADPVVPRWMGVGPRLLSRA